MKLCLKVVVVCCRRKIAQKTSEYEEQLEVLLNKCSSLEKAKSRLQSEVEVLVMDLEKVCTQVIAPQTY